MATTNWVIDPSHSEIQFKVKHLMITNVTGNFKKFSSSLQTEDEDFSKAVVSFTADIDSITTGDENRDGHLKSADFFDAANHPQMKFVSTGVTDKGDGAYELSGDLTIRETTQNIKLAVEFGGVVKDPWGNTKAGFSVIGKLKRKEFGLSWDAVTEAGGIVVSDEVRIICEVQFIKQP